MTIPLALLSRTPARCPACDNGDHDTAGCVEGCRCPCGNKFILPAKEVPAL